MLPSHSQGKIWDSSVCTSEEGALLKGSRDMPAGVLLLLTWPVTAHNPEDTDPTNSQLPSHFTLLKCHSDGFLRHHLKYYEMEKKYISIIGGEAIHSVDISQYTSFVFEIRNFFLTLLHSTAQVCPQHLIAIPGCLICYDNCSVLSLHFKFSKTKCIFLSCGLKCFTVIQQKHN